MHLPSSGSLEKACRQTTVVRSTFIPGAIKTKFFKGFLFCCFLILTISLFFPSELGTIYPREL
jgi:hypothetical protein